MHNYFKIKNIKLIFKSHKLIYIVISALISALGLTKSFLFLKFFNFFDLGIININQNFAVLISFFQIGIITGGYRLFSYKNNSIQKKVNSTVLVYFIFLTISLLIGCIITIHFFKIDIDSIYIYYFLLSAILNLYSNWVISKMLALKEINILNKVNLLSAFISLSFIFSYKIIGVWAALATFSIQPIILIFFSYYFVPKLIPFFEFNSFKKYYKKIISVGFIPFLTTALGYLNNQIGRWLITVKLGTIALGKSTFAGLFIILVNFFPIALSNLFFPILISHYEKKNINLFRNEIKKYFLILLIYSIFIIIFSIFVAEIILKVYFPKFSDSILLIYTILPALIFQCLSNPSIMIFNALKEFKSILYGSLISVFIYLSLLIIYINFFTINLVGLFIIESISAFIFFLYNVFKTISIFNTELNDYNNEIY